MKKTITKEVTCCDCCEKEEHMETCINCKVEHCYACSKTEGKKYSHAVNFGGSSDGYHCPCKMARLAKEEAEKCNIYEHDPFEADLINRPVSKR